MLSAYLDDDLSPTEQEIVRRAIQADETVRVRYHELAAMVSLLRTLPPPAMPRSFTLTPAQVQELNAAAIPASNLRTLPPRPQVNRLTPLFGAFSAIAAVLLVVLITADFATGGFRATAPTAQPASHSAVEQITATTTIAPAGTGASGAVSVAASPAITSAPAVSSAPLQTAQTAPATGAVRPSPTTSIGLPLALIRAVEIALAIIVIAGLVLAVQGARARPRHITHG